MGVILKVYRGAHIVSRWIYKNRHLSSVMTASSAVAVIRRERLGATRGSTALGVSEFA